MTKIYLNFKKSLTLTKYESAKLLIVFGLIHCLSAQSQSRQYSLKILPNVQSLSKPSNQKFVITCKGHGGDSNLFSELHWFTPQDNEINDVYLQLHPEFKTINRDGNLFLSFDNPKPELSGNYKCKGLLQSSEFLENSIHVQIYEDVTWDHCPQVQYLIKGNVGERINCRATANPKPNIIWTKEGQQLDNNPRYLINSSGILIKDHITEDDGGQFQVSALVTETGATHEKYITVQIYSKPNIEFITKPKFGVENEELILNCNSDGFPEPQFTWLDSNRRNLSTVGGYAVDRNHGTLIISKLDKLTDQGNFTCIAENAAGKSEKSTNILVYQRPAIRSFRNESYDQFQRSFLQCRIVGHPDPKITIRKNGWTRPYMIGDPGIVLEDKIENRGEIEKVLTLTFLNTTRNDDGLYYCRAENDAGFAEVVGHLEVKFSPNMSLTPMTLVKTWDNRPVNMTCIADAIPNATIRWYKNGYEIFNSDVYQIENKISGVSRLFVSPIKSTYDEQVFGIYRCEGTNSLGKGAINIQLERATVPGVVDDIKIVDVSPTKVLFKLYNGLYDGGMPIKKLLVEYYQRDDQGLKQSMELPFSPKLENVYILDKLKPFTWYIFRFAAQNDVGKGIFGSDKHVQTKAETRPDKAEFHNLPFDTINRDEIISPYPHKFTLMWNMPPDNGRPIEYFEIRYYQILKTEFGFTPLHEPLIRKVSVYHDEMTSTTLSKLKSNSFYRVELRAYNSLGYSDAASIIFKTPQSDQPDEQDQDYLISEEDSDAASLSSLKIGVMAGIFMLLVIVFLIIMDLIFYYRCQVGVTYFLVTHLCSLKNDDDQNKLQNFDHHHHHHHPPAQSDKIKQKSSNKTVNGTNFEEYSPMLTNTNREREPPPHLARSRDQTDSAV